MTNRQAKAERQRGYHQSFIDHVSEMNCWCGRPAVRMSRGSQVCQHCLDIEAWLDRRQSQKVETEVGLPEYHLNLP